MFASTGEGVKDFGSSTPIGWPRASSTWVTSSLSSSRPKRPSTSATRRRWRCKFLAQEDFTFDGFLQQMAAIKKMGSLKSMLGMMPGMGQMRAQLDALDEREFDRVEAMVQSMTPFEADPPQADQRLAPRPYRQGVGVTASEVNASSSDSARRRR